MEFYWVLVVATGLVRWEPVFVRHYVFFCIFFSFLAITVGISIVEVVFLALTVRIPLFKVTGRTYTHTQKKVARF